MTEQGLVGGILRLARGAKQKWALGLSGLLWLALSLGVCGRASGSGGPNPLGPIGFYVIVAATAGFVATAVISWLALFVADVFRHGVEGRPLRQRVAIGAALWVIASAAAVSAITFSAAFLARPGEEARREAGAREAQALLLAGGPPPARCEGAPMPPAQSTGPSRQLVGAAPVWLQFATLATIVARSEDLVLTGLGTAQLDNRVGIATFWAVTEGYPETVVVRIIETRSGEALLARGNSFDGRTGGNLSSGYRTQVVEFVIPRAGCYIVEAMWPGDSWRAPLAAGQ